MSTISEGSTVSFRMADDEILTGEVVTLRRDGNLVVCVKNYQYFDSVTICIKASDVINEPASPTANSWRTTGYYWIELAGGHVVPSRYDAFFDSWTAFGECIHVEEPQIKGMCHTPAQVKELLDAENIACENIARDRLRDTSMLLSNPPQSSAAWSISNNIAQRRKNRE